MTGHKLDKREVIKKFENLCQRKVDGFGNIYVGVKEYCICEGITQASIQNFPRVLKSRVGKE